MKRRYQVRNWLIYACILGGMGTYASFYSEKIPKMCFYFLLLVPVVCLVYTFLVYARFCLWQEIPSAKIIKNQTVPYHLAISNEDVFSYANIRVCFSAEYSKIDETTLRKEYGLLPVSRSDENSTICGMYRGTYFVGVDTVEITDFLSLFSIRYPIHSKLKIIVWPRVVNLKDVSFLDEMQDQKNIVANVNRFDNVPDLELRKYVAGDPLKRIHWKASARCNELLTRKEAANEEIRTFLYMDTMPIADESRKIATEDKIVELALAISKYYLVRQEQIEVIYEENQYPIASQRDFERFYQECVSLLFLTDRKTELSLAQLDGIDNGESILMVISPRWSADMFRVISGWNERGVQVIFFYIKLGENEKNDNMLKELVRQGIHVEILLPEDDLEKVFVR